MLRKKTTSSRSLMRSRASARPRRVSWLAESARKYSITARSAAAAERPTVSGVETEVAEVETEMVVVVAERSRFESRDSSIDSSIARRRSSSSLEFLRGGVAAVSSSSPRDDTGAET